MTDLAKTVIALARISSGHHETGEPLSPGHAAIIARLAIQAIREVPPEAMDYFERHPEVMIGVNR